MVQLQKGYRIAVALSVVGFLFLTRWLLASVTAPGVWVNYFGCGLCGMACGYGIVLSTQYYTDYAYEPVRSIAEASTTGHGTNIITGISVGMKSTCIPTLIITVSVLLAYHLAMACFLLFGAFMDEFSTFAGIPFTTVDIAVPEVLVSGLIGSMIIFFFTGLSISAVGKTAHQVVLEVRRQFQADPGIMTYKSKPDYKACVSLVTKAALEEMRLPAAVCVGTPIAVGLAFRIVGEWTNRPLLGAECLASYLMFGTVTGILMATFLDITGGAWDNAKKYVELGNFGGKNSEAHKASVTGDTVGDPFKDTAGPSLHVVIKLLSTTILVLGPLFISNQG
ncbi:hypothetical protein TrCOL_g9348 [Triparma columacea]|uniref:H(+)-exporting diphosphatase n=1 Tax=Triparma columacea TaxID=722753 RepID=A0A9W7LCE8_9STRA|nr:hypothetical protein TrCOL_g9348 [Triparma columacea]